MNGHHSDVALVAEHRDGHDLAARGLGSLHRGNHGLAVEQRCRLAEQMEHADAGRRRDRFAFHALRLELHPDASDGTSTIIRRSGHRVPARNHGDRVVEPQNNGRILAAELVGTLVLMLGGPGVAILLPTLGLLPDGDASTGAGLLKILIIALGFGFSLLIMWYVIGPISGCHINPAVTLGMLLARKVDTAHAVYAWIGQVVGAIGGAGDHLRHRQRPRRLQARPVRRQPVDRASTSDSVRRSSSRCC